MRGVSRQYGRVTAIAHLDLDIEPGEFITLLGPSGSGKSTTLMVIAGFETPSSGEVLIDGRSVLRVPPHRRNLGMVFQNYALFPHLTVAENIGFPLRQRGVARDTIRAAVARMLDLVQLAGLEGRYPQQLSGGQQQRVAIARAIVFNPPILLMDEPLSALDKQLREGLLLEIRRLHASLGITFIYVTHDQREALVMSDRVAVMNLGRLEQIDTPQALYDRPVNRFVAAFVGEANFLEISAADGATFWIAEAVLQAPTPAADATLCMVRPEKIFVRATASAQGVYNALPATVRESVFMGETTRYLVQLRAGQTLTVRQPHRADLPVFAPGDNVFLEWAIADTTLM